MRSKNIVQLFRQALLIHGTDRFIELVDSNPILLANFDFSLSDYNDNTLLELAIETANYAVINFLKDRGVDVTVHDIFLAISSGNIGVFHSLLAGVTLLSDEAMLCAERCLRWAGTNSDVMARTLFKAFNIQLHSGRLARIIEEWVEGATGLDNEMNYRKTKIVVMYGYEASLNDISAAAQSATIHKMIFENLPPFKLEVLAARALRAKMFSRILSFDVLTQMNDMLEDPPQISSNAWDAL